MDTSFVRLSGSLLCWTAPWNANRLRAVSVLTLGRSNLLLFPRVPFPWTAFENSHYSIEEPSCLGI